MLGEKKIIILKIMQTAKLIQKKRKLLESKLQAVNDDLQNMEGISAEKNMRRIMKIRLNNLKNRKGMFIILRRSFKPSIWNGKFGNIWRIVKKTEIKMKKLKLPKE